MSLIARHIESRGIPTLCMGSAWDIMEAGNAPRAVYVDYPLGHTTGKPNHAADQYAITRAGLGAFETIDRAGTILALPNRWATDDAWKAAAFDASQGDERSPRDETPRYQVEDDRIAAEGT